MPLRPLLAATLLLAAAPAMALGTFDGDTEGWLAEGNGASPTWQAGGYLGLIDADNGWASYRAPAAYLAPVALGGSFAFDLKHSPASASFPLLYGVRVALQGAGLTLIAEAGIPTTDWVRYRFALDTAGGWRVHGGLAQDFNPANPAPTAEPFAAVLGQLDGVFIAADDGNGNLLTCPSVSDYTDLDNVSLVPEPASAAVLGLGLATLLARRRRSA